MNEQISPKQYALATSLKLGHNRSWEKNTSHQPKKAKTNSSLFTKTYLYKFDPLKPYFWGWLGGAKVSYIFFHRGVQLILAYSWARPAILVAGKGREVMFLFLLFLHFHSCSSFFPVPLFHLFCYLFCLFSLSLGDDTKWPTRVDVSLNHNSINQTLLLYWKTGVYTGIHYFSNFCSKM